MPSAILEKFGTATAMTITLASLSNSSSGIGRQSTIVDNTTARYQDVIVFAKIKLGTSPTANQAIYFYLIRDDGVTNIRTDGAGATDAALTIRNAELVGTLITGAAPATGDTLSDGFLIKSVGPKFGIAVVNNSGVNLDATAGNHLLEYIGVNVESQ